MRKYITFFFILFGLSAHAQVSISYSAGYSDYKMTDAKQALENMFRSIKPNLPENLEITENFPGYITHNLDLTYQIKSHEVGAKFSYYTTGGIIAYSDYSGKYKNSAIFNGYKFGLIYRIHFWVPNDRFSVFFEISPALVSTDIKYKLEYPFSNQNVHKQISDKDSESAVSIQPLLGCRFAITKNILIFGRGGYDYLFTSKSNPAIANWSGIRGEAGITWKFN